MWQELINWLLNTFKDIGDFANWLTTPIDLSFEVPMISIGSAGIVTTENSWVFRLFDGVMPIQIVGVTFLTVVIGFGIWHLIWLFS